MSTSSDATRGIVLILISSTAFGVCGPFGKAVIQEGVAPIQVTWLRVVGVSVVLLAAALPALRTMARPPVLGVLLYGLTAIAGVQACYFLAVERLPVGIALLLEFMGPVVVVAWVRLVRRTRLPRAAIIGTLLSIAGLCVVVEVWTGMRLDALGLVAGAGAAACQASYYLGGEKLTTAMDIRVLLAIGFVVGAIALTPLAAPWTLDWSRLGQPASIAGVEVAAIGCVVALVACTALAYATGLPALRLLSAPVTGAMGYAEVVVAALAAWVLLGEALTVPQIVGGCIVIAGVFTAQRAVSRRKDVAETMATTVPAKTTTG